MLRRTKYVWELEQWPHFRFDANRLLGPLGAARRSQGELRVFIEHLGFHDRDRVELEARTSEAVETAQIEDEPLSRVAVRSSIERRLHLAEGGALPADAKAEGVVDMTLDATVNYAAPLTIARLHRWHAGLFPIDVGNENR